MYYEIIKIRQFAKKSSQMGKFVWKSGLRCERCDCGMFPRAELMSRGILGDTQYAYTVHSVSIVIRYRRSQQGRGKLCV